MNPNTLRNCSCCGESYRDGEGHDLKHCIDVCQSRYNQATNAHANAAEDLIRSYQRLVANLEAKLKKGGL